VLLGMRRDEVMERMGRIIEFSGLADFIESPVRVYSSGMVARLGFSVAVHIEPDILLIDEVLAVGDMDFQKKCMAKMEEFRSRGTTMVFVSHSLADVQRICSRAALLDGGRLVAFGEPQAIVSAYTQQLKK
jgi:ABC-type polysaccharide/polyol phosphate transport system ATPase subunit